ncbi:MAG: ABC transporter ATP-binding protein [Clostridia bacterium]|nr:ABC transporter ATP-binding protein [Clostridia bacterium]MBQ6715524.1 ABC transporter ATP-binding protein [Clostridia bacterium]
MTTNKKTGHIIECDNLVKIYKTPDIEVLALQGLDLTVDYGEMMAIIGNSGSGKSTFLNMLGGLDRPSAGKLLVDGKDLFKLSDKQLVEYKQKTVGFVWQNNARNLLPYLTAIQNVMMPMLFSDEKKKRARAEMLLDMVALSHRKNARLSTMSGGEQQRVAIAIALANHPRLLLADEPTGSVDQKTSDYILDMLREINRESGVTIVIVTHDQLLAKKVNRVVAIRDGKISSERIMKDSYLERLHDISAMTDVNEVQDEYVVMDKAGRLQLPSDMLKKLGVKGNRVRMEMKGNEIIIRKPFEEET